ncbi:MAG: hypothetical protein E7614_00895 [Ruminococcaceae bacterium]|nr:hypothetical protein [Oscillospiraceae bacterium]
MFGYVRVHSPQLKVWENELYKSIYCGLCRHGGKRTTRLTRFFLSYDFVALATVRMALTNDFLNIEKRFCPYFPKRKNMISRNASIDFTSDSFVILAYYKQLDDKTDTKGLKKFFSSFSPFLLKKKAEEAQQRNEGLGEHIKKLLFELSKMEKENCSTLDFVADNFAILLGKVVSFGLEGTDERIAYEIGYHIGRYIYIIDALDDFKKDLKENNYNPLVLMYSNIDTLKENCHYITDTLEASMEKAKSAFELIDTNASKELRGIIENIMTYGSKNVIAKTLEGLEI